MFPPAWRVRRLSDWGGHRQNQNILKRKTPRRFTFSDRNRIHRYAFRRRIFSEYFLDAIVQLIIWSKASSWRVPAPGAVECFGLFKIDRRHASSLRIGLRFRHFLFIAEGLEPSVLMHQPPRASVRFPLAFRQPAVTTNRRCLDRLKTFQNIASTHPRGILSFRPLVPVRETWRIS